MILHSLRLRGFKGLRAGIGLDEIFIDFDRLPQGLVAIVGANGMGKTTILDNCHPYRIMAYKLRKAKDWSPNAFSFYDQCEGEALKELVFSMGGARYRSVVMIDAERRKQEAYLYEGLPNPSTNGGLAWNPLNDGKTRTYDEAVEKVCGSPTLFFSSVFRSQGAKNLSDYTRGDIVSIISELLNIDRIKEQGEKARQVANELAGRSARIGLDIGALEDALAEESEVDRRETDLLDRISCREGSLNGSRKEEETLRRDLADAEQRQKSRAEDEKKLSALEGDLAAARKDRLDTLQAVEDKKRGFERRRQRTEQDIADAKDALARDTAAIDAEEAESLSRLDTRRSAAEEKLTRARKIAGNAEGIRGKVREEGEKKADLEKVKADLAEQQELRSSLSKVVTELRDLQFQLGGVERNIALTDQSHRSTIISAEEKLNIAKADAAKLDGVDCRADSSKWVNDGCRFICDAVAARDRLPELEKALADAQEEPESLAALRKEADELKHRIAGIANLPDELTACEEKIQGWSSYVAAVEAELVEIAKWTKLVPDLERAEADIAELTAEVDGILKEQADLRTAFARRRTEASDRNIAAVERFRKDLAEIDAEQQKETAGLTEQLSRLGAKCDDLELQAASQRNALAEDLTAMINGLQTEITGAQNSIREHELTLQSLHAELGKVRGQLEAFEKKRKEKAALEARRDRIDAEAVNWKVLARACSNDGVIALELDDASPSIAAIVNDLLRSCYGPRFSVRMETQTAKTNGDMKEDFDITIIDSETDDVVSITEKSGGQMTWLDDAITRGICLFNIHRSDRVFGTIYSDEKDGQLDSDKKVEFMAVKRRAMELGTHSREFFISQTSELVDMADGRIVLSPGKVEVM